MITYVENMKTIPTYGIWMFWNETSEGIENVSVYEGYLDCILLKLGSRYDNIHVKLLKNLNIDNETPPYTRAKQVHFFLHDMDLTNLSMDDRLKYLKSLMIGRHADTTDEIQVTGEYTYYTLEAHMSEEEKRKEEIQEILNKLDPEDSKRLETLWKKQYDYEAIKRHKYVENNKISITKQTEQEETKKGTTQVNEDHGTASILLRE